MVVIAVLLLSAWLPFEAPPHDIAFKRHDDVQQPSDKLVLVELGRASDHAECGVLSRVYCGDDLVAQAECSQCLCGGVRHHSGKTKEDFCFEAVHGVSPL